MTLSADISTTAWKIDSQILNRNGIGVRLGNVQRQVSQIANSIAAIRQTVESGAMMYDATETQLVNMAKKLGAVHSKSTKGANYSVYEAYFEQNEPTKTKSKNVKTEVQWELFRLLLGNADDDTKEDVLRIFGVDFVSEDKAFDKATFTTFLASLTYDDAKMYFGKDELKGEGSCKGGFDLDGLLKDINEKWDIDELLKEHDKRVDTKDDIKDKYFDKDLNEIEKDDAPAFYDRKADIFEVKGELEKSYSLWAYDESIENGKISAATIYNIILAILTIL